MRKNKKLKPQKDKCEICGANNKAYLHAHHIIPRRDYRSTDNWDNIAICCANCHNLVHSGDIIIIGVYYTTNGRQLMFHKKGEEPMLPEEFWLIKDNPLVITK